MRSAGVARRVVANDPAPVVIELAGACTQIGFTPAAGQLFVETLSSPAGATSGFTLVGPQTETFFATPEDDRGNILLNAAGPDVRLGSSGAHLFRVRRDGTIDNAFQLKPIAQAPSAKVQNLVPRSASCSAASLKNYAFGFDVSVYIEDAFYDSYSGEFATGVDVFDGNGNPIGSFSSFDLRLEESRGSLAYDPYNKYLYVGNVDGPSYNEAAILVYDLNGKFIPMGGFPGLTTPLSVAFDTTDRTLFVGDQGSGTPSNQHHVKMFDEAGNVKPHKGTFPYMNVPIALTWDAALDRLYARDGDCGGSKTPPITEYIFDGEWQQTGGSFNGTCDGNEYAGIAYDSKGKRILVLEGKTVEAFDTNGNALSLPTNSFQGLVRPAGIAIDDGVSYITNCGGLVKKYTAAGADITLSGAFPGLHCPTGIVVVP